LRRFNKEMLYVEELLEPVALEVLITRRSKRICLVRKLYALLDRSLFKAKQFMKNHIWI
jgi:hypothetical protein